MNALDVLEPVNFWGTLKKAPGVVRPTYVAKLLEQRATSPISAVVGVRRAGKSTILHQVLQSLIANYSVKPENTLFVNLEDPRLLDLITDNSLFSLITAFKQKADLRSKLYVVLDEIQNVENWQAIVRTIHDQEPNIKLFITGSSAQLLGQELGTKLSGRYLKTEIFPLSFSEFQTFTGKSLDHYLKWGGFPNPVLTKLKLLRDQLLADYFESILLRDISARYGLRNEFKLRRLAAQLFSAAANQASSYRLSKDLDLAADTILQYFSYIEDAYLGFFIPKFDHSVRKQNYNPKKFYPIDTGLQSAVSFKVLDDTGKALETAVFLTLRRKFTQLYYWEEEKEINFIVKHKEVIKYLVNVSVTITNQKTLEREKIALQAGMYQLQHPESYLVTMSDQTQTIQTDVGTIHCLPFHEFELFLNSN